MLSLEEYRLGVQTSPLQLESSQDNYNVALTMLTQCKRDICIYSRRLDGRLYDCSEFGQALQHLASQQPRVRIRILLTEIEPLIKYGHRIIELARRLSSAIAIRRVHEDYRSHNEAFMVFDEHGVIRRQLADRYEGIASFNDANQARHLLNFFNEVWEVSEADPNLRRLHI